MIDYNGLVCWFIDNYNWLKLPKSDVEGFKIDYNKKKTDPSSYKNFVESFLIDRLELK